MKSLPASISLLFYLLACPLNAAEPIWQQQLEGPISGKPLATDQGVYVAAGKTLYQFSGNGQLLRKTDFTRNLYATPVAYSDGLLIHAEDGLHALDRKGNRIWHHSSTDEALRVNGQTWGWGEGMFADPWAWYRSSVTHDGRQAYYGTATGTYAVDLENGNRVWHADTGVTHTTPILVGERLVVGSWDNHLYGLDPQSGELLWQFEGGTPRGASAGWIGWLGFNLDPVSDGESVYVGNRGSYFYRIDGETGKQVWAAKHAGTWIGSPAIVHQDKVYYGLSDGLGFMVQKRKGGNIDQFIPMPHLVFASPLSVGEQIFFATLSGELFKLDSATGQYERVYQTRASAENYPDHVKADGGPIYQQPPAGLSAYQGAVWQVRQMLQGLDSILGLSHHKGVIYLGTAGGKLIALESPLGI